jgi:hypothetical protein
MRIIITENQYNLLTEQSNVYTDEVSYKNALKTYDEVWKAYNKSVNYYNFVKLLPKKIVIPLDIINSKKTLMFFTNQTKKTTADSLTKNAEFYKKNGLEVEFWYVKDWWTRDEAFRDGSLQKGSSNETYEDVKKKVLSSEEFIHYPYIIAPLFKKPNIVKPTLQPKTPPLINYKELKSETTFAPQYKTGTPVVQVGTYYMTYPEFEAYKKSRPNTTFKKI